jgi:amino acid transporter
MEIFLVWFGLSLIAGYVGGNKGHSGFAFFLLSLILTPLIGLTYALVAKDLTKEPALLKKLT